MKKVIDLTDKLIISGCSPFCLPDSGNEVKDPEFEMTKIYNDLKFEIETG